MTQPTIAVIGAGPGGTTLARVLHRYGIHVTIFEREALSSERSQGGSLDLHPDTGQYALECCALSAEFTRLARYQDQESRLYDKHGNLLFLDEDVANKDRPEIDRGQLRQMLIDALPATTICWDHQLASIRPVQGSARFELSFKNDERACFDLVVGADGAWSRVRSFVSEGRPEYSGVSFIELGISNVDQRYPGLARLAGHGLTFILGEGKALICHRNANAHLGIYAGIRVAEDWIEAGGAAQRIER